MRNNILYTFLALFSVLAVFQSCHNEAGLNYQRYYVNGKGIYEKRCQNCHGAKGEGLGRLYPPLTDTVYLRTYRDKLACIIKNGMQGEVTIHNTVYDEPMPGNPNLADIDIAQLIVYISNSFGNEQGFYDVAEVGGDLENCN